MNACDPEAPGGTLQSTVGQLMSEQLSDRGPRVQQLSYSSLTAQESGFGVRVSGMNILCISTGMVIATFAAISKNRWDVNRESQALFEIIF